MLKNLFSNEDFSEDVCEYLEKMNYLLKIRHIDEETKKIEIIDSSNDEIIIEGNSLEDVLKQCETFGIDSEKEKL